MIIQIWPCRRCGRPIRSNTKKPVPQWVRERAATHAARGLCARCLKHAVKDGTLADYDRYLIPRDLLLEEWELLRSDGVRLDVAAQRLGTTATALDRALHRALSDGDQRARHTGCYYAKVAP